MSKSTKKPAAKPSKTDLPSVRIAPLSAFSQDSENANKGTEKGTDLLKKSLSQRKFARPTFAAKDLTILGGNKTLAAAAEVGMQEAIVVESDGSRPIIHVRTDLPNSKTPEARRLAIEDNRIAQVSLDWDDKILGAFAEFDKKLLEGLWDEDEIKMKIQIADYLGKMSNATNNNGTSDKSDIWQGMPEFEQKDLTPLQTIHVHFKSREDVDSFAALVNQTITPKTKFLWYPKEQKNVFLDKAYVVEP